MKKIKTLHISHSAGLYGADKSMLLLLENIDREKYEPIVIIPRKGPLVNILKKTK